MIKIFIDNKVVIFTSKEEDVNELSDVLILNFFLLENTIPIIDLLEKDRKTKHVVFLVEDVDLAFNQFKQHFKVIKAAGGIVKNKEGKFLFIHRLGKWDLPKGKIEKNEGIEEAAIREVEEECGISEIEMERLVADTFHVYSHNEKVILKQTHWFTMNTEYEGELVPQAEENITDVCWLDKNEIEERVLINTYDSIADLLRSTIL